MIPDVVTGDPRRLYCLNCARRTVSPSTVSRYNGLTNYLRFRGAFTSNVKLTFARMDGIIGENLPMAAYKSEQCGRICLLLLTHVVGLKLAGKCRK